MTQTRRHFPESYQVLAVRRFVMSPRRWASLKACWANGSARTSSKVTMPFRATASSEARARSCVAYASNWLRSLWSAMF